MKTTTLDTLKRMSKFVLLFIALLSIAQISVAQDRPKPPPIPPMPTIDDPRYVPGPVHRFVGSVIVDKDGNTVHLPTRDITRGWYLPTPSNGSRGPYINGQWLGEANLWFSGNWAFAYASSALTNSSTQAKYICARVDHFYINGISQGHGSNYYCDWRTAAYSYVTSPEFSGWSGCFTLVDENPNQLASNDSAHKFKKNNGFEFEAGSDSSWGYRCST